MYFATSCPRLYFATPPLESDVNVEHASTEGPESPSSVTSPKPIVALKKAPNSAFFAAISAQSVYLWSTRPTGLLSCVKRSEATLIEDGENADIIWKPDALALVVVTNKGYLHFYDVYDVNSKLYEFQFSMLHHYHVGPGEGHGIPSKALRFRMALEIDTGVQCGIGLRDELVVCTIEVPSILSLSWEGEVNLAGTVSMCDLEYYQDSRDGVGYMVVNDLAGLHGWLSVGGKAYVSYHSKSFDHKGSSDEEVSTWSGLCCYNPEETNVPATSIAINPIFLLIAIGTEDGNVYVYSLSEDRSELRFSHSCIASYQGGFTNAAPRGAVKSLEYSDDGHALAVGWALGGISIWSVFGRLLTNSTSEDTTENYSDDESESLAEEYLSGVQTLFWGPGGYELFILPSRKGQAADICTLSFAKSALTCCNVQDNARCLLLILEDKLMVYEGNYWDFDVMNLDMAQWENIQMPIMYISQNWPIKYATINATGHYIAIAGKRGLAHYSAVSNRWKLFGNEQQEQNFSVVGGMLWHKDILIVACQEIQPLRHQLRFFSRESNLGMAQVLHTERIPSPVVAMNNLEANLLVFARDNVMRYYTIATEAHRIRLQLRQQISLDGVVFNPTLVQSIAWYTPVGDNTVESVKQAPVVILSNGELSILREAADEGWEIVSLSDKIEFFWVSRQQDRVGDMLNSLWAYDASGFKIWPNLNLRDRQMARWKPNENLAESLRIGVPFYPLTIMMHRGMVAGVEQRISSSTAMNCGMYRIETKTHLFIHTVIRHMLSKNMETEALTFAEYYRNHAYFNHALEVLLHQVLEVEAESYAGFSENAILPRVVRFLERFPGQLDIIAQCARKTEVSLWEYFFSIVGDPKSLFKKSLEQGALKTATSYLIIIQTLEPASLSGKFAVELLERAFQIEDFETSKELARFLTSIQGPEGEVYREIIRENSTARAVVDEFAPATWSEPITGKRQPEDNLFYMELLISKHARELLRTYRLRAFGRLAIALSFPMKKWLVKERNRSALVEDWATAFAALHEQFHWPWPRKVITTNGAPNRRQTYTYSENTFAPVVAQRSSQDAAAEPSRRRAKTALPVSATTAVVGEMSTSTLKTEVDEPRMLLSATSEAGCRHWTILLSSMLMDVATLRDALADAEGRALLGKWRALMLGTQSPGYHKLLKMVEDEQDE